MERNGRSLLSLSLGSFQAEEEDRSSSERPLHEQAMHLNLKLNRQATHRRPRSRLRDHKNLRLQAPHGPLQSRGTGVFLAGRPMNDGHGLSRDRFCFHAVYEGHDKMQMGRQEFRC